MLGGSILDLVSYGMAPSSIVTPVGSLTLVVNIGLAHWWLGEEIYRQDWIGSFLIITGATLTVIFGNQEETCLTVQELTALYATESMLIYMIGVGVIVLFSFLFQYHAERVLKRYVKTYKADKSGPDVVEIELSSSPSLHADSAPADPFPGNKNGIDVPVVVDVGARVTGGEKIGGSSSPTTGRITPCPPPIYDSAAVVESARKRSTAQNAEAAAAQAGVGAETPSAGFEAPAAGERVSDGAGPPAHLESADSKAVAAAGVGTGGDRPRLARISARPRLGSHGTGEVIGPAGRPMRGGTASADNAGAVVASAPAGAANPSTDPRSSPGRHVVNPPSAYEAYARFHPVSVAVLAGTLGAQTVLFAKSVAEAVKSSIAGSPQFGEPWPYVFAAATIGFIVVQQNWLAHALRFFDASFVVPVFQGTFITVSVLGGVFYFQELDGQSTVNLVMFPIAVVVSCFAAKNGLV